MTCIVGLEHNGNVYIGGDSAGVAGHRQVIRKDEKVFRNGEYVFGFAGSFRMGQLLRYAYTPPEVNTWDLQKFMVTEFIDSILDLFDEKGFDSMGAFLVGIRGRLFCVEADFQVGWNHVPFSATGSGETAAMGALDAMHQSEALNTLSPNQKLEIALNSASNLTTSVSGPYIFASTE